MSKSTASQCARSETPQIPVVEPGDERGEQIVDHDDRGTRPVDGQQDGSNHSVVIVAAPTASTVCGTSAGIHSARERGRIQTAIAQPHRHDALGRHGQLVHGMAVPVEPGAIGQVIRRDHDAVAPWLEPVRLSVSRYVMSP